MFFDGAWVFNRSWRQKANFLWLGKLDGSQLALVEIGAGRVILTGRHFSKFWRNKGAILFRINPRQSEDPRGALAVLEALQTSGTVEIEQLKCFFLRGRDFFFRYRYPKMRSFELFAVNFSY